MSYKRYGRPLIERLQSKIKVNETTGCHEWTGATSEGYGNIKINGETKLVHRVMYELVTGKKPYVICHKCHNRKCCKVDENHVTNGSYYENNIDRKLKPNPNPVGRNGRKELRMLRQKVSRILASLEK